MTKEKIKEIIKAYSVMINPSEIQSVIALERLTICDSCEYNKKNLEFLNVVYVAVLSKIKYFQKKIHVLLINGKNKLIICI